VKRLLFILAVGATVAGCPEHPVTERPQRPDGGDGELGDLHLTLLRKCGVDIDTFGQTGTTALAAL
jgi:hypothetical protein